MRYKRKTYSGVVLEQEVYFAGEGAKDAPDIERRLWHPKTEAEKKAANERQSQKRMTRLINSTFAVGGSYVTLTYDDKHLPETWEEAEKILKKYIRVIKYKFPNARIVAVTGEGRRSGRLHHHLIIAGAWESYIVKKWTCGSVVRIEPLRAHNYYDGKDCGRDYTALALYLWAHSASRPKKGKRWVQTKNCVQPEAEKAQEIRRDYSAEKPPRTPKGYRFVYAYEGKNGYLLFKYVKDPPHGR